jgi:hypothetical protein
VRKHKVETIPQMVLRMENEREECWIPKMCFWGGEFETAVVGLVLLCAYGNGWMSANDYY